MFGLFVWFFCLLLLFFIYNEYDHCNMSNFGNVIFYRCIRYRENSIWNGINSESKPGRMEIVSVFVEHTVAISSNK